MSKLKEALEEIPSNQRVPTLVLGLIVAAKGKDMPQGQYVDYVSSATNALKIDASRVVIDTIASALADFLKEDRKTALEQMAGLLLAMGELADKHRERELRVLANLHELIYSEEIKS